ncbi:MAG: ABC transporter permease [Trueperaceae bacterium]
MTTFILKRLIATIPTILIVGVAAFLLVHLTPGDPADFFLDPDAPAAEADRIRARLGLDQPIGIQFVNWFGGVLQGDLGQSFHEQRPVREMFARSFPPTLYLALSSLLLALIIALPIGILSAIKQDSALDRFATIFVLLGVATPSFWLGLLLIQLFSVTLGWMPAQGSVRPENDFVGSLNSLVLPSIALGYSAAALIARMTRSGMLEVLRQDYIRTARAKGVSERDVNYRHALWNAFNPILTVIGLAAVSLISGSLVVELVFNFPGVGPPGGRFRAAARLSGHPGRPDPHRRPHDHRESAGRHDVRRDRSEDPL